MRAGAAGLMLACAGTPLLAGVLYGTAHPGGPTTPSTLYRLCPEEGSAFTIGAIGFSAVGGIDVHPVSGALYGVGKRALDGTDVLILIDPIDGTGVEVGPLVNTASFNGGGHFDLSFRPSDAQLFLTAFRSAEPCVSLFTVDLSTGTATEVGDTHTCGPGNALGFAEDGTLYHANKDGGGTVYTVDTATGASGSGQALSYAGFPTLLNARPNAMDFGTAPGLAFVGVNDGLQGGGPNYLGLLDPLTGQVLHLGLSRNGLDGLAWSAQGEMLFGQTVLAGPSTDEFGWSSPLDFEYVRGLFATSADFVGHPFDLHDTGTGPLLIDAFLPPQGEGAWYLLRAACPSASWSSGGAGECPGWVCGSAGRDANLP